MKKVSAVIVGLSAALLALSVNATEPAKPADMMEKKDDKAMMEKKDGMAKKDEKAMDKAMDKKEEKKH